MTDCIPALQRALGEAATPEQLEKLYFEVRDAIYQHARTLPAGTVDPLIDAARRLGDQRRTQAFVAQRNAAFALEKRAIWTARIHNNFGNDLARGFESMMMGIQSAKTFTRDSAATAQKALRDEYLEGLQKEMRENGLWELFKKGGKEFDRDTFKAWYALDDPNEATLLRDLNPQAIAAARIISKWTEHARIKANAEGAWIGKLDNWAGRQTHNAELIANAGKAEGVAAADVGKNTWLRDVGEWFDIPRMLRERDGTQDANEMLQGLYKTLASAVHESTPNPYLAGTSNIARGVSESRSVHFINADAAWAYNQKYGGIYNPHLVWAERYVNTQSLINSVAAQFDQLAEATGLMRIMGPNPRAQLDTMIAEAEKFLKEQVGTPTQADALKNLKRLEEMVKGKKLDNYLATLDGTSNQVGNQMWARIGMAYRALEQMASLGSMLLAQFSDPVQHMAATSYRGRGFLPGLHEHFSGLFVNFKDPDTRRLAGSLGVSIDNFLGEMLRAGSFDAPGDTSKMLQFFYKINFSNWWNTHMRFAGAAGLSRDFAQDVGKTLAQLHEGERRILGQYGIGAAEWDVIRAAQLAEVKGERYLVAENISNAKVADQWRTLISDQSTYSQLEPGAKTRAMLLGVLGNRPRGTAAGEVARAVMMFKSFPAAIMEKTIGRELFGRGFEYDPHSSTNVWNAIRHGENGERAALANIIIWSTALGYVSLLAKDLAKGIAPQDPSTLTNNQRVALVGRALMQGGGAGIYGDFLLGNVNRFGNTALETAAGPGLGRSASTLNWVRKVFDEAKEGEVKADVKAQAVKGFRSMIPGNNLFWARYALDAAIMDPLQESISPGYKMRQEARMQKDSQQHFIMRPPRHADNLRDVSHSVNLQNMKRAAN